MIQAPSLMWSRGRAQATFICTVLYRFKQTSFIDATSGRRRDGLNKGRDRISRNNFPLKLCLLSPSKKNLRRRRQFDTHSFNGANRESIMRSWNKCLVVAKFWQTKTQGRWANSFETVFTYMWPLLFAICLRLGREFILRGILWDMTKLRWGGDYLH